MQPPRRLARDIAGHGTLRAVTAPMACQGLLPVTLNPQKMPPSVCVSGPIGALVLENWESRNLGFSEKFE